MKISKVIPGVVRSFIIYIYIKLKYKNVKLHFGAKTDFKTKFGGQNVIQKGSKIFKSKLGKGSYIAGNSYFTDVYIGKFCSIGDSVRNNFGIHPSNTFVSIHPCFYSSKKQAGFTFTETTIFEEHKFIPFEGEKYKVVIGNDVWIGSDVKIMDGVTINDGAIIASGAIVTKDVEAFSIVGGIPAKHIKFRFTLEEIEFLNKMKWWDKSFEWLKENSKNFHNIEEFTTCYKK